MSRLLQLLLCMLVCAAPARARAALDAPASAQLASDQAAAEAYRRGDLDTARSAWSTLLETGGLDGAERARLAYNLGNVAFRQQRLLEAVGWYGAALRLRPRDADTWANLEHARTLAKLEPADRGDLTATLHRLLGSLTIEEGAWLVIAAALLWLGLAIGEALRGGRVWRRLAFTGLGLVVACLPLWIYPLERAGDDPLLVIAEGETEVQSEPRAEAAVIAKTSAGVELERIDELAEWTKVRLADGRAGWVERRSVFALKR